MQLERDETHVKPLKYNTAKDIEKAVMGVVNKWGAERISADKQVGVWNFFPFSTHDATSHISC